MKCKFCASDLEEGVIKCKHCGEFVDMKYKPTDQVLYRKSFSTKNPVVYCSDCGYEGKTSKLEKKGSIWVTLILLWFFIVPAIIYEVWRGSLYYVCPECKGNHLRKI